MMFPLARFVIDGPLYNLGGLLAFAGAGLLLGLSGCYMLGDFKDRATPFIATSIAGGLLFAGGASLIGLIVGNPARALSRSTLIAGVMLAAGYAIIRIVRRAAKGRTNAT